MDSPGEADKPEGVFPFNLKTMSRLASARA